MSETRTRSATGVVSLLAGVTLLLHFLTNGRYGFWIDELYFIACGEHLAWGYVDQPPLIAVVANVSRAIFGDTLFAIRFFPALAAAALVMLTGYLTRAIGGGRFAQILAAVTVMVVPVYLAFGNLLTMNAFEPLLWTAIAYLTVRILTSGDGKYWLLIGLVVGIGLLNKYSVGFFSAALIAALLLVPERRILADRRVLLAAALAVLIVLPNLWWQFRLGWPTLELMRNAKLYQHQPVSPLDFIRGQVEIMHPLTFPIWVAGTCWYLVAREAKPFRFLGWTFVLLFAAAMWSEAKTYYLAPAYPIVFAGGARTVERLTARRGWAWLRYASVALLLLGGMFTAPYALPLLPVASIPDYTSMLSVKEVRPERRAQGQVPQLFADMLAWEETVAAVAQVYASLSPEEQSRTVIWGGGYGDAGAVDLFGRKYNLPRAVSGHQNYYLWGPGDDFGDVVIAVGMSDESLRPWFERVELATTVECPYCMPDRMTTPIHICRGLKLPLREFWEKTKCWTCDTPEFAARQAAP